MPYARMDVHIEWYKKSKNNKKNNNKTLITRKKKKQQTKQKKKENVQRERVKWIKWKWIDGMKVNQLHKCYVNTKKKS